MKKLRLLLVFLPLLLAGCRPIFIPGPRPHPGPPCPHPHPGPHHPHREEGRVFGATLPADLPEAHECLSEVNAVRKARQLPPFARDESLTAGAKLASQRRALQLREGHLDNDFLCLPEGAKADASGCAAWLPAQGWGACCTYDDYQSAGAAWALGTDGRRYMHLFVRHEARQEALPGMARGDDDDHWWSPSSWKGPFFKLREEIQAALTAGSYLLLLTAGWLVLMSLWLQGLRLESSGLRTLLALATLGLALVYAYGGLTLLQRAQGAG